jgi:adenosylmethionine-8-amino-7-oxononanoate aminotransferase
MSHTNLVDLDRAHLIHPLTSPRGHERRGVTILESGRGVWLRDSAGNELLDAFAGLWCVNVGYGQESVVRAATEQMMRLPYATNYFSYGSEPAIRLAGRLVELAPRSLRRVYFTMGGSDAVDSAIRYITNYFNAIGQPRRKHFISLKRGYHGSSATGSGVTALPVFHRNFDVPLANQHHLESSHPYRNPVGSDPQAVIASSVAALRAKVAELGADTVAAFFCEPVQGSGGVVVPPVGWLKAMATACKELGILLVVDEVITGFGRTGPLFACEAEGVEPDMMTLAKGLTSGYAPMGALMMSEAIYAGIADASGDSPVGHGHTYSGHPVSAAIGLEVLRLYHEGGLLANGQRQAVPFAAGLQALLAHPLVGDARSRGLVGALELVADKGSKRSFSAGLNISDRVTRAAYARGVVFRAFTDGCLGFAPALCLTADEVEQIMARVRLTLDDVLAQPEVRAELA